MAEIKKEPVQPVVREDKVMKVQCQGCGGLTHLFQDGEKVVAEFFPAKVDNKTVKSEPNLFNSLLSAINPFAKVE
jgi:hypothetical protein